MSNSKSIKTQKMPKESRKRSRSKSPSSSKKSRDRRSPDRDRRDRDRDRDRRDRRRSRSRDRRRRDDRKRRSKSDSKSPSPGPSSSTSNKDSRGTSKGKSRGNSIGKAPPKPGAIIEGALKFKDEGPLDNEAEQQRLETEMQKRRERIEKWRAEKKARDLGLIPGNTTAPVVEKKVRTTGTRWIHVKWDRGTNRLMDGRL